MTHRGPVVGLVTIGQSPRVDVVPDMAAILGPGVETWWSSGSPRWSATARR
jgi:hypothetical protein